MAIYISNSGNDGNDGLSDTTPVQTLNRLRTLYAAANRRTDIFFKRGDTFGDGITLEQIEVGQGSAAAQDVVIGDYGDPSAARPLLQYVQFYTSGSGLYNATFRNFKSVGVFGTASHAIHITRFVGAKTITVDNCDISLWAQGVNVTNYLATKQGFLNIVDTDIYNNSSIGLHTFDINTLSVTRGSIVGNAFGTTPGVRTHNKFTHGIYSGHNLQTNLDGVRVEDNGSFSVKISSDEEDGSAGGVIQNCTIVDGFTCLSFDGSSTAGNPLAHGYKHRNISVLNNTFRRTRHAGTARRVDAEIGGSATRDYWDRIIWLESAAEVYISGNTFEWSSVADDTDTDTPNSFADQFVYLEPLPQQGHVICGNTVSPCPVQYNGSSMTGNKRYFLFGNMSTKVTGI